MNDRLSLTTMTDGRPMRTILWWSSGKDCAWSLHLLRARADIEIIGLATTVAGDRVPMHGVPLDLLRRQAEGLGLPLTIVPLPEPYGEEAFGGTMRRVRGDDAPRAG